MRVCSVNTISFNHNTKAPAFSHNAVPYPEFENAYSVHNDSLISGFVNKISHLFKPEVTSESKVIKSQIDNFCENNSKPEKRLMSVLA